MSQSQEPAQPSKKPLPEQPLPDEPLPDEPLPSEPLPEQPFPEPPLPDLPQSTPRLPAGGFPGLPELPNLGPKTDDLGEAMPDTAELPEAARFVEISGVRQNGRSWKVIPHASVRAGFTDNLFISNTDRKADAFFSVAPGLGVGWGDFRKELKEYASFQGRFALEAEELEEFFDRRRFIFANYTPSATFYADQSSQDSVDHDLSLAGEWTFKKLTLGFGTQFQTLTSSSVDIGGRVKRTLYSGELTSRYDLSEKVSLEANFSALREVYDTAFDSTEWKNQNWVNYQVAPKTNVGVGVAVGRLEVRQAASQTFQQVQVRGIYGASRKLNFRCTAGVELRQVADDGPSPITPVVEIKAVYNPFPGTSISLGGSLQTVNSSGTANQNITVTSLRLSARQHLFHKFYLTLTGEYGYYDYKQLFGLTSPARRDKLLTLRSSFSFDITKRASVELSYDFRTNDSTLPQSGFEENRVALQVNYIF